MATYYVSLSGSNSNPGTENSPFLTLPHAIAMASNGDTIIVMAGTHNYGSPTSNNVGIFIDKQLTIVGRQQSNTSRPIINISTASNVTAVICNASNITISGIEFNHMVTTGSNDTCINIFPGGTPVSLDSGEMVNQNINIIDCKIFYTKFGISSKAKSFTVNSCELVSKALTTARAISIYSQDGNVEILNNVFTSSVSNNAIELLHNNFATGDSYQNKRNGSVSFLYNITQNININRRAIFFEASTDTGLVSDKYSLNIFGNIIHSTSDCMLLLQPTNANFLNFIDLISVNNNNFINNPTLSNNGLVRVASFVTNGGPLTVPTNNPKFLIQSNTINNDTLILSSNPYNVDNKNVLIFTGFSNNAESLRTGGLTVETINSILITDVVKVDQTLTFELLTQETYSPNGIINLTASSTSDLEVSFLSSNTNVIEVNGSTLIIKGVGSSIITASQAGNEEYNPANPVQQTQVISKADQTIIFNDLSSIFNGNNPQLNATSTSELPITYTQDNDTIVSIINGNEIVFNMDGRARITASQSGDENYNAAIPLEKVFVRNSMSNTNYTGHISALGVSNSIIEHVRGTLTINIKSYNFTQPSGTSYLKYSGFAGAVIIVSIVAKDEFNNPITDFSSDNLTIRLSLPHANPLSTLLMYKLDSITNEKMSPQPAGYPVTLEHQSNSVWKATLSSLSDYVIQDSNPPSGAAGGDPHLVRVNGKKILLPNDWKYVRLYKKDDIQVNAKCGFIDNNIINNLHCLKNQNIIKIDPLIHKYVLKYTFFIELDIFKNDELVFKYDLINNKELLNKNIAIEENKSKTGLYSIVHKTFYDMQNYSGYFIHLNNNNILKVDIDNFWDDINCISLALFDRNIEGYSGVFFNDSVENKLI